MTIDYLKTKYIKKLYILEQVWLHQEIFLEVKNLDKNKHYIDFESSAHDNKPLGEKIDHRSIKNSYVESIFVIKSRYPDNSYLQKHNSFTTAQNSRDQISQ